MSRRACSSPTTGIRFRIEAPQVSWLGDSLRLPSRCRKSNRSSDAAFPLRPESRDSERRTVARAENFRLTVARRRRLLTVFPCAESLVIVDGAANHSAPRKATRASALLARPNKKSHESDFNADSRGGSQTRPRPIHAPLSATSTSPPGCAIESIRRVQWLPRKITRGRPVTRNSTSSGASNTSSSKSR